MAKIQIDKMVVDYRKSTQDVIDMSAGHSGGRKFNLDRSLVTESSVDIFNR